MWEGELVATCPLGQRLHLGAVNPSVGGRLWVFQALPVPLAQLRPGSCSWLAVHICQP